MQECVVTVLLLTSSPLHISKRCFCSREKPELCEFEDTTGAFTLAKTWDREANVNQRTVTLLYNFYLVGDLATVSAGILHSLSFRYNVKKFLATSKLIYI